MARSSTASYEMAEEMRDAAREGAERMKQMAESGVFGMRELAERNVDQARGAFEGLLSVTQQTLATCDRQASEARQTTLALAARTLTNSFEFAQRLIRARSAKEILQLQAEFAESQMHALADQTRELGETFAERTRELGERTRELGEQSREYGQTMARNTSEAMKTTAANLHTAGGNPTAPAKEAASAQKTK